MNNRRSTRSPFLFYGNTPIADNRPQLRPRHHANLALLAGAAPKPRGHDVVVDDRGRWRGVVIAEGLHDPTLINDLRVTRAFITGEGQPLDEDGTEGRWPLYWVNVSGDEFDRIQAGTRHAWYAHFWQDDRLLVVYDDARFSIHRHDQTTWRAAVDHGLQQGLRPEWLDFPTDDSAGTLD